MAWLCVILAGFLEIGWALGLRYSDGFTRFWPSVVTVVLMVVSFLLLGRAAKVIPIGTAYAVWTGIGAVGTAVAGMLFLHESREWIRLACIVLIVIGIVGLKHAS